jgi:hypothetical protein
MSAMLRIEQHAVSQSMSLGLWNDEAIRERKYISLIHTVFSFSGFHPQTDKAFFISCLQA